MIGAAVKRTAVELELKIGAGTMSSEPQEGSVSEQLSAAEGTIVQNEEELCRQRRLLDSSWNPQLQLLLHHIVLPQHWVTEEEDLCNQQRNFRVEQEEPEPPQIKEELQDPEPPQIEEEPEELFIIQDEGWLDLKQETDTLMEIPPYEEDENSEADLNNQQSFNVTDSQDEEVNQDEESTSTSDEETDPLNRDQRKRRDRSHVQSVDSSHMSEVLPQHWVTEEDLCNQHRNVRMKLEEPESPRIKEEQQEPEPPQIKEELQEPEPPQIKEEQQEPEPPQIKEELQEPDHLQFKKEQDELCISQYEQWFNLKQETDTLMEIPTYEEDENSEADLNNQQGFNVTDSLDEKGSQHEESTSTTDEETDPQNRDQRKRRDRSHVQSVDSSHMSESECVRKKNRKASFIKKHKQSPTGKRSSYIKFGKRKGIGHNVSIHVGTKSERPCEVCEECVTCFDYLSQGRIHMRAHTEGKHFLCKECDKSFSRISNLKRHMRIHTGEKAFACEVCGTSFCQISNLKRHMITHTGEKHFACEVCGKKCIQISDLKAHKRTHTGEKPFSCKECDQRFSQRCSLKRHISQRCSLKRHMRTHTGEKPFALDVNIESRNIN